MELPLSVPGNFGLNFPDPFEGEIPRITSIPMVGIFSFLLIPFPPQKMGQFQIHDVLKTICAFVIILFRIEVFFLYNAGESLT